MTRQEEILGGIVTERARQDKKWGGPDHDDLHDSNQWDELIWDRLYTICDRDQRRTQLVQIAALAVAALESLDRQVELDRLDREATS